MHFNIIVNKDGKPQYNILGLQLNATSRKINDLTKFETSNIKEHIRHREFTNFAFDNVELNVQRFL